MMKRREVLSLFFLYFLFLMIGGRIYNYFVFLRMDEEL